MQRNKRRLPLYIAVLAIGLIAVFFIFAYFLRGLTNSDYFRVDKVIVKDGQSIMSLGPGDMNSKSNPWPVLSELMGLNLFSLDLGLQRARLLQYYPAFKNVRMVKVFPRRVFVEFDRRSPLAAVKLGRYFLVDVQGVLFDVLPVTQSAQGSFTAGLPVISGLTPKIPRPKIGERYGLKELVLALDIIKEMGRLVRPFSVREVNVANPAYASCILSEGLEVKFGRESIKEKVGILNNLLVASKNDLYAAKYIDLRFKEPVIKFILDDKKGR